MFKHAFVLSALAGTFALSAGYAAAADQEQTWRQAQVQQQDEIYGSQLMTPQERAEYRARMRSLRMPEEREAFRLEHHRLMQERARESGLTLPDMPPSRAGGMGPGGGMGSGGGMMGPGGGGMMGPGGGGMGSGGGMMGPGGGGMMGPGGGGMMGPGGGMGH